MQKSPQNQFLLDADGPNTVRLSVAEATQLGLAALKCAGYSGEDARIIVDQLVDNALCGYVYSGLPRVLGIAEDEKTNKGRKPVRIVHETPLSALVDGGNNVGYIAAYRSAEITIDKVRTSGMASVGAYNSYYSGRNSYYVEKIVREGFVVMHVASAMPRVLPQGGKRPALGTNPICFGFPSEHGPVIIDMGTAAIMLHNVELHARLGQLLPEGVGFDAEGRPTRDAAAVLHGGIGAFGGYKGYGLSIAVQALGLLAGSALKCGEVQDYGFLFWAVNPEVMLPGSDFKKQMSELVRKIKETPRQPGVDEIRIPSERAFRERERRRKEGIVIERRIFEMLKAL